MANKKFTNLGNSYSPAEIVAYWAGHGCRRRAGFSGPSTPFAKTFLCFLMRKTAFTKKWPAGSMLRI